MDNASKALRIAGGVLIALLVVGLVMWGYNEIIRFQKSQKAAEQNEQSTKFNQEIESYNRKALRGYNLVSLGNLLVTKNRQLSENDGDGLAFYEHILDYRYPNGNKPVRAFMALSESERQPDGSYKIKPTTSGDFPGAPGSGINKYRIRDIQDPVYQAFGGSHYYFYDVSEYIEEVFNNFDPVEEKDKAKMFKEAYFQCIETSYDKQNSKIYRLLFIQVHKSGEE